MPLGKKCFPYDSIQQKHYEFIWKDYLKDYIYASNML